MRSTTARSAVHRLIMAAGLGLLAGLVALGWLSVLLGFGIEVQALALDLLLLGTVLWPRRVPWVAPRRISFR